MPDLDTITLVIVEDHVAVQKGVEALLRPEGIEVLGAATDAEHGYELLLERRPRVALVDVNLPGQSGAWLVERALVQLPDLAVLLYTGRADSDEVGRALAAGARGVALKAGQPAELIQAIRSVAAGEKYIDPRVEPLISIPDQPEPVASQSSNGGAKASGAWDADAALAEAPEGTPDFLDSLLAVARIELDMELMLVGEFTESGEILRFVQGDAESFGVRKGTELPFDSTYSGHVMANRIPNAIPDTRANEVTAGMAVTAEANVGAYVGVPVRFTDGRHYGMVAGLSHVPRRRFSHRGMRLLEVLGRFLGEELEQRELELRYELSPAEVQSVRETRRQQQVREIMSELCRYPAEGRLVTTPLHEIAAILSGRRAPETPRQALLTRHRTYLGSGAPTMRSSRH